MLCCSVAQVRANSSSVSSHDWTSDTSISTCWHARCINGIFAKTFKNVALSSASVGGGLGSAGGGVFSLTSYVSNR